MKIVHVCLIGTFTDKRNYQENVLSKYHAKLGHEVYVITSKWIQSDDGHPHVVDPRDNYIDENGVHVIRLHLKGKQNLYKKFKRYDGLFETLTEIKPDFIFIHGVASIENNTLVKYLKKNRNVRACADNHADFSNSATNWISKNILHGVVWKHYAKKLVPVIEKFYGVLPARVDFLVDIYGLPKEKCDLLVMGADDELVEAADKKIKEFTRNQYHIGRDDFLITTGGKIDAWKTQTLLLMEAVKKIDNPKIKLLVFGSVTEELMPKVQELADGDKVQYIGWIQANDTYRYFATSDLVVFPGRHSVFWEQVAAQGIPMICKDWNGTHHVDVGGNVLFLSHDSVDEIQQVIEKVVSDKKLYQRMMNVAREKGRVTFSYREIAKRCIQ